MGKVKEAKVKAYVPNNGGTVAGFFGYVRRVKASDMSVYQYVFFNSMVDRQVDGIRFVRDIGGERPVLFGLRATIGGSSCALILKAVP